MTTFYAIVALSKDPDLRCRWLKVPKHGSLQWFDRNPGMKDNIPSRFYSKSDANSVWNRVQDLVGQLRKDVLALKDHPDAVKNCYDFTFGFVPETIALLEYHETSLGWLSKDIDTIDLS